MMMLETYCRVMQPAPVIWTFAPRPSMVLKLFTMSSSLRWIIMFAEKTIQRGSS
ncbi:unnamed protein product [Spirodela intermedia]|uniref:Uncharacterized protein n=2 Tax=Spirodela intermedia TaxID=51605 RepID=A0A7I8ICT7_SPIIN|nr:unnamed protein product [Spirodela intermedia]CAA6655431.1 unnamed protein product [Spirodela intermedia]CAA7390687.1 unnamed protein product [Spirodela intermedia]